MLEHCGDGFARDYRGGGTAYEMVEKTICKAAYQLGGSLGNNDDVTSEPVRTPGDVLGRRGKKMSNAYKAPVLNERKSADQT